MRQEGEMARVYGKDNAFSQPLSFVTHERAPEAIDCR